MTEVLHEIVAEIGADPGKFAIEVVQFLILVALVYVVAIGVGKRKGMFANILVERRRRVEARVERAAHAEGLLAQAREQAATGLAAANAEASAIIREARASARASRREQRRAADAEAATIRTRARQVLDEERAEMAVEVRDRLVGVVAQATRALLNEGLSQHEQRQLIQGIVSSEVERLDDSRERRPHAAVSR